MKANDMAKENRVDSTYIVTGPRRHGLGEIFRGGGAEGEPDLERWTRGESAV